MEKIFKKSLALMVSAALCLTAFVGCLTVNAEETATPTYEITAQNGKAGDTVEVKVDGTNLTTVCGQQVFINIPSDLQIASVKDKHGNAYKNVANVTEGEAFDYSVVTTETTKQVRFADIINFPAKGELDAIETAEFHIVFSLTIPDTAAVGATYDIAFDTKTMFADIKENEIGITVTPATITVQAAVATTHKVTFVDADGNTLSEQDVNDGEAAVAPELPRKIGYSAAWDKEYSNITEDTVVTATYTAAVVTTKGIGAQLGLERTFTFTFSFAKTNYTGGTLLYAVVNKLVADSEGNESYVESVFEGDDFFSYDSDNKMAFYYSDVAAKEMTSTITIQFYYELDGVLYSSKVGSTSVAKYALNTMKTASGTKATALRTLCVDMLNYGAEAQQYFGYRTDDLANEVTTATDSFENYKQYATTTDPVITETTSLSGSHLYGMGLSINLTLGNTIDLNFLIKPGTYEESTGKVLKDTLELRYSYTTAVGTVVNEVVSATDWADNGDGRYRFAFNVLAAKDLRTPVTFGIYDDNGNAVTKIVTTSIAAYSSNLTSTKDVEMGKAIFRYSDSAKAYFVD